MFLLGALSPQTMVVSIAAKVVDLQPRRCPIVMAELFPTGNVEAPLADRMRPSILDDVMGQSALIGPDGVLSRFVGRGEVPSMVLWGPPGCGKTTIARLLADAAGLDMVTFSAVLSGVKEARAVMAEAGQRLRLEGRRTMLFVDEIHRFNRAQQDAFLSYVEAGEIILVGATTENPSFELNRALLSRVKVYVLNPLSEEDLVAVLNRALNDEERGLLRAGITVDIDALDVIARVSSGDARQALTMLELVVTFAASEDVGHVDIDVVSRVAQRSMAHYDKGREDHFNQISALHKSVRNSDVDAALYWLGRMLEGGADPRFVVRRLLRMASEDIGMADPRALEQVAAAAHTVEHVGMPECELALAQCTVYLALAAKSNALYTAYGAIKKEIQIRPGLMVPMQLRNAPTALMKKTGYGAGYQYAHDSRGAVSNMECLPDELVGTSFFKPTSFGWESRIGERLKEIHDLRKKRD